VWHFSISIVLTLKEKEELGEYSAYHPSPVESKASEVGRGCSDPDAHSATQEDFDVINMTLLIKDKHSISGRAYHEMASVFKTMRKTLLK